MKPTVLLVEDSQLQKLANEKILTRAGYLVLLAGDGEDALRLAREAGPDLVLLDMNLPKLSGDEVLWGLKQNQMTAPIPVIVLSHLSDVRQAEVKAAGAAGYFEKPKLAEGVVGEAQLIDLIKKTLRESQGTGFETAPAAMASYPR